MKKNAIFVVVTILFISIGVNFYYLSNQITKINFYSHADKNGALNESILEYESTHPKIKINLIELPDDTNKKYELLSHELAKKDGTVDIIDSDVTWPASFVNNNWVEPLDKYLSASDINDHFSSAIEASKVNGKIYGMPYRFDSGLMYYRKDLLDKYGFEAPNTYEEMVAISKTIIINEKNITGYAGSWKRFEGLTCNFLELYWANGGKLNPDSKTLTLDPTVTLKTIQFMHDVIHTYQITDPNVITYSSGDARKAFASGNLIFLRDWPAGWSVLNAADSKVKGLVGVMPLPHTKRFNASYGTYGGWQYMVSKYSRSKKESVDFVKFITSENQELKTFRNVSYLPSRQSLYFNTEIQSEMPFAKDLLDYFNQSKPRPRTPFYTDFSLVIQTEVHNVLSGTSSPEKAVENITKRLESIAK